MQLQKERHVKEYVGNRYNSSQVKLKYLLLDIDSYDFDPPYQRGNEWIEKTRNYCIDCIMDPNHIGDLPEFCMYSLTEKDNEERSLLGCKNGYSTEVLDGKQRLTTLKSFYNGSYVDSEKEKYVVHYTYKEGRRIDHVFYKETSDVIEFCKKKGWELSLMTEKEKYIFENTILNVKTYHNMTMDQRSLFFTDLQRGQKVTGSDLLKNNIECKITRFFRIHNYEQFKKPILSICTKQFKKFYIHQLVKFKLCHGNIFCEKNDDTLISPCVNSFLTKDPKIKTWIDSNNEEKLNFTEDELRDFDKLFKEHFIVFIKGMNKKYKINPSQLFALFAYICMNYESIDKAVLLTHMPSWSDMGKEKKDLWEKDDKEDRKKYFNECLKQLEKMNVEFKKDNRKITQKKRKQLWENYFKGYKNGLCQICKTEEITFKTFESGHIESRHHGGTIEIDNLLPMCRDCNKDMRTRNAEEYQLHNHPEEVPLIDLIN
jgi:hypothetical protein